MNKRTIISFLISLTAIYTCAQTQVVISDGTDNAALRQKIENNASRLLNEINAACAENRALRLNGLMEDKDQISLESLWENVHFQTEDSYIEEALLDDVNGGYQIRNISIHLDAEGVNEDESYKEAVINFSPFGSVTSINLALDKNMWKKVIEDGVSVKDIRMRQQILHFVEKFRTAYNQKDLPFLNQIFSEDALIITGTVISGRYKTTDGGALSNPRIKYTKKNKQQYLAGLKSIFARNSYINVTFDDIKITRDARPGKEDIYGVTLKQGWNTSTYSDEGYLFMIWDFSNPDAPEIHVRTWQPYYLDKKKSETIPEEEIFTIQDFEGF